MITYTTKHTRSSIDIPFYIEANPDIGEYVKKLSKKLLQEYAISSIDILSDDKLTFTKTATFATEDDHEAHRAKLMADPVIIKYFNDRWEYNTKNNIESFHDC